MHARLIVDPRVVQLAVQPGALEALDDGELRIQPRLDGELPQDHLAEGVDGLRSQLVDARELLRGGGPHLGRDGEKRMR